MSSNNDTLDPVLTHVLDDNRLVTTRIEELLTEFQRALRKNDLRSSQELEVAMSLLHQRKEKNQILLNGLCEHDWSEPHYGLSKCERCDTIKQ